MLGSLVQRLGRYTRCSGYDVCSSLCLHNSRLWRKAPFAAHLGERDRRKVSDASKIIFGWSCRWTGNFYDLKIAASSDKMFAKPRAKKSILPRANKKRKNTSEVEEVTFDNDARQEYLTGFHKRKQQRIKNAQEAAVKRARQEKLDTRKQVRLILPSMFATQWLIFLLPKGPRRAKTRDGRPRSPSQRHAKSVKRCDCRRR